MNGIHNQRTRNATKPVPGCLGRVVNFFDLSTVVPGNRLLTDIPHFDGIGHSRRQSDAMRISPIGDALDDDVVASDREKSYSNRNFNGTSVKMLIAEEMSKEVELKHNSPNLVAKLMGLDTLPSNKQDSAVKRSHSRSYSGSSIGIKSDSWQREHYPLEQNGYKEFPDMRWQSRKEGYTRDKPPEKGRRVEASDEKKMALVRQKFVEAKSLSTNEKLRQTKQFEDALEVLSSNRGLFLKLLQEPNSYSQNLHDFQCVSPSPKAKRITVLKPSKILDDNQIPKSEKMDLKPTKKAPDAGQVNKLNKRNHAVSPPGCRLHESPTRPTRIVVLKPSEKLHHTKSMSSPSPSSQRERGHRREETLMSSVFSNGYSGDESSFHKSENEFILSDYEDAAPTSPHSWDYIHRLETPNCSSSFSHVSCSPESSVCREAKKRLSERWALMSSNDGNCQQQRHLWKSSSTLGEMLALSDTKNNEISEEDGIMEEQKTKESLLCSSSNLNIDQFVDDSLGNLLRSQSVPSIPGSPTEFVDGLNRALDPKVGKADISKEMKNISMPKSSFKEKFSSLFSLRNKRPNKDKSSSSGSSHEPEIAQVPEKVSEGNCKGTSAMQEDPLRILQGSNSFSQDPVGMERKPGVFSPETKLCKTKPSTPVISGENQDQPSPVSVLEPPFDEYDSITTDSSNIKGDKSPPIESIPRLLSWDDPCGDTANSIPLKPSSVSRGSVEEEEQELLFFVKSLLSTAGFDGDVAPNSLLRRWHSPESPLDPSLRDSYIDTNANDIMHEPRRKQMRMTGKLVFDCVNTALGQIIYGLAEHRNRVRFNTLDCSPSWLVDEVWARVKEWLPSEVPEEFLDDDMDSNSLVVEATARKEVLGNVWTEHLKQESDDYRKEIEVILLEELVHELVVEFSGRV